MSQNIIKVGGASITLLGYLSKETLSFIRISKRVATSVSNTLYLTGYSVVTFKIFFLEITFMRFSNFDSLPVYSSLQRFGESYKIHVLSFVVNRVTGLLLTLRVFIISLGCCRFTQYYIFKSNLDFFHLPLHSLCSSSVHQVAQPCQARSH